MLRLLSLSHSVTLLLWQHDNSSGIDESVILTALAQAALLSDLVAPLASSMVDYCLCHVSGPSG